MTRAPPTCVLIPLAAAVLSMETAWHQAHRLPTIHVQRVTQHKPLPTGVMWQAPAMMAMLAPSMTPAARVFASEEKLPTATITMYVLKTIVMPRVVASTHHPVH